MIRSKRQNISWEAESALESSLDALLTAPGRVVKESQTKIVSEHQVGGHRLFVKRYRHFAVPGRPLKFFFKPSQAQVEWRLAQSLSRLDIPCVKHVALGERWSAFGLQESVLVTEAFDGVPANEFVELPGASVIAFVERMADAGVLQADFHPANLLVRRDPLELRLVDLHGITVTEHGSSAQKDAARDSMLAQLAMSLPLEVSARIRTLSREIRKQALQQRARRCLKSNREFSVARHGDWNWQVRTAEIGAPAARVLSAPDKFLEEARALKRGRSATVAAGDGMVLKRYNFKKPLNLLKDLFRGSRARRSYLKGYHLELCGIATPRVLATADHRVGGFPVRSYVLMTEVAGAIDAGQWTGDPRMASRALGTLLAQMHDEGFTHRDLKETNILFDRAGCPNLIDLDGLKYVSTVSDPEARENLERLAEGLSPLGKMTRSNVLGFLLAYCRRRHLRPRQLFPRGPG